MKQAFYGLASENTYLEKLLFMYVYATFQKSDIKLVMVVDFIVVQGLDKLVNDMKKHLHEDGRITVIQNL